METSHRHNWEMETLRENMSFHFPFPGNVLLLHDLPLPLGALFNCSHCSLDDRSIFGEMKGKAQNDRMNGNQRAANRTEVKEKINRATLKYSVEI